jgi:hypothetical protein
MNETSCCHGLRQKVASVGFLTKVFLIANLGFWIYCAVAFIRASYPFVVDPWGHPSGYGVTFWGRSIAIKEDAHYHTFFRGITYVEGPSLFIVRGFVKIATPVERGIWGGISPEGWALVAVFVLSFGQWYLVGWICDKTLAKIRRTFHSRPSAESS